MACSSPALQFFCPQTIRPEYEPLILRVAETPYGLLVIVHWGACLSICGSCGMIQLPSHKKDSPQSSIGLSGSTLPKDWQPTFACANCALAVMTKFFSPCARVHFRLVSSQDHIAEGPKAYLKVPESYKNNSQSSSPLEDTREPNRIAGKSLARYGIELTQETFGETWAKTR